MSDPKPLSAAQVVPFLRSVVASGERLTPQDVAAIRDALDAGVRVEPAPEPTCRFCGAAIERDGPDWMHVVPVPGHLPEHDPKLARQPAPEPTAALRPCARYFGSDGTLCATHNGRFASPTTGRCDRSVIEVALATPSAAPDPLDIVEALESVNLAQIVHEALGYGEGWNTHAGPKCGDVADRIIAALTPAEPRPAPVGLDALDLGKAVAIALSTTNHALVRAAPDGVACRCGQYDDTDHGEPAAELWRAHLIEAARAAIARALAGHQP